MRRIAALLSMLAILLTAAPLLAADEATIKKQVDDMIEAINNGKPPASYAADAYQPYAFIMEANGLLLVHPYLAGESLPEKAAPIYQALQQATTEGIWVEYFWKGAQKHTYVRRTKDNLTVGSGN